MRTKNIIILLSASLLVLSGCVSKKKYLDMEWQRNAARKKVAQLNKEKKDMQTRITAMIADYETIKADLLASNAQKDQMITNLHGEVNEVSKSAAQQNSSMEDKLYEYDYEKRQLQSSIDSKQKSIDQLTQKNKTLATQLSAANNQITNLKFDADKHEAQIESLNSKVSSSSSATSAQKAKLKELETEIASLKTASAAKDQEIKKLKNNVKLLKNQ